MGFFKGRGCLGWIAWIIGIIMTLKWFIEILATVLKLAVWVLVLLAIVLVLAILFVLVNWAKARLSENPIPPGRLPPGAEGNGTPAER
jgi:hypothetical protein